MVSAPALWNDEELSTLCTVNDVESGTILSIPDAKQGTGFTDVPSNNYPFYSAKEKYWPVLQQDGGQLSEWKKMYEPDADQAERDKRAAFEAGVPHGIQQQERAKMADESIALTFASDGPSPGVNDNESSQVTFELAIDPQMRIVDLQLLISGLTGIAPGLQRLSYAGKEFNDAHRTLQHYGVAYWHGKFPHWPIRVSWR